MPEVEDPLDLGATRARVFFAVGGLNILVTIVFAAALGSGDAWILAVVFQIASFVLFVEAFRWLMKPYGLNAIYRTLLDFSKDADFAGGLAQDLSGHGWRSTQQTNVPITGGDSKSFLHCLWCGL